MAAMASATVARHATFLPGGMGLGAGISLPILCCIRNAATRPEWPSAWAVLTQSKHNTHTQIIQRQFITKPHSITYEYIDLNSGVTKQYKAHHAMLAEASSLHQSPLTKI